MAAKPFKSNGARVFLVRHGKPKIQDGLCYGQTDIPSAIISPFERAQLLAQLPSQAAVFSSPLQRCYALASSLFPASSITTDANLMELHFGDWEMRPWDLIERAQLDAWAVNPVHFVPPQGESFNQLCQRVRRFVHEALKPEEPAIIITHGGVIKAFLYMYAGMELNQVMAYSAAFASVTEVVLAAEHN
jgi:alpha-ribazole phosphatase